MMSADNKSEHNIDVSSANIDVIQFVSDGISAVKTLYNIGDRHEPCGQPAVTVIC